MIFALTLTGMELFTLPFAKNSALLILLRIAFFITGSSTFKLLPLMCFLIGLCPTEMRHQLPIHLGSGLCYYYNQTKQCFYTASIINDVFELAGGPQIIIIL